jgi:LysM repeat protein
MPPPSEDLSTHTPPRLPEPPPPASRTYVVRKGDTLSAIAARHGVSVREIESLNSIQNASRIRVGQELQMPVQALEHSGLSHASTPGRQPTVRVPAGAKYTVKSGDTLGGIAAAHGTTVAAVREANGLKGNTIRIGQKLTVPAGKAHKVTHKKTTTKGKKTTPKKAVGEPTEEGPKPTEKPLDIPAEPPPAIDFSEPPAPVN